jgi:soluble lytic murein transglycosylase-like protein
MPARSDWVTRTEQLAQQHGVPQDIALRWIAQESGFDVTADNGQAFGLGQITADTARLYGVENVQALSPEQNIQLAFRILLDNFQATGNWQDALSMYHSGVNLQTAARQRRNDGNMSTVDYVRGISG